MNNDMDYCSGVGCKIKNNCLRYTESEFTHDDIIWWIDPAYHQGTCPNLISK